MSTPSYTQTTPNANAIVVSAKNDTYLNVGAVLGGEANYKGTFARAEVGLGTALNGKVELGHEFGIGKNMGLELSAKAQTSRSLVDKNIASVIAQTAYNSDNFNVEQKTVSKKEWHSGMDRLGAGVKLTFGSKKAKFGVGFESGIAKGTAPDKNLSALSLIYLDQDIVAEAKPNIRIHNKASYYGTPTVSADIKLSKNLSFNANADLNQAQAGIRWNF